MNVQAVQCLTVLCFVVVFVWQCFGPRASDRYLKNLQCLQKFEIMANNMDFNVPVDNGFAALSHALKIVRWGMVDMMAAMTKTLNLLLTSERGEIRVVLNVTLDILKMLQWKINFR